MRLKEFLFEKVANWKTIEGWPNYEVSNTGLVRISKTGKILKQAEHYGNDKTHPYMRVMLHSSDKRLHARVHRLVATAFLGKPEAGKTEVDHLDGNTRNNTSGNLEWVTPEENLLVS